MSDIGRKIELAKSWLCSLERAEELAKTAKREYNLACAEIHDLGKNMNEDEWKEVTDAGEKAGIKI